MIKCIDLIIDHRIAQHEYHAIAQEIHELCDKTIAGASDILQETRKKFLVIDSICAEFMPVNECIISVKACEPVVRINRTWVWTRQGLLVPQSALIPRITRSLADMYVQVGDQHLEPHITPCCSNFITSLSAEILEKYVITWVNEYEVCLQDNIDPTFAIYIHSSAPIDTCIEASNAIKKDLKKRGRFDGLHATHLVADARFDGQIVVREQRGGYVTRQ